jgi:hypothetical protein
MFRRVSVVKFDSLSSVALLLTLLPIAAGFDADENADSGRRLECRNVQEFFASCGNFHYADGWPH